MNGIGSESNRLRLFVNIFVLGLSLYGISLKDYKAERISLFDNFLIDSFSPIQGGISSFKHEITSIVDHYLLLVNVSKQNVTLKHNIEELENRLFILQELERENRRLKDLLKFGKEIPREMVLAQIIGWDADSNFRVLRINKGISDGIMLYSTVVTAKGLVGYIYRLTDHYADILTILDRNNRVDAIATRTRSHGIVEGFSHMKTIMKYVTRTEPIELNDQIITAGLGDIYPKGLMIGTITKIKRESYGITQGLEVTPSVDFGRLEEVVVLRNQSKEKSSNEN